VSDEAILRIELSQSDSEKVRTKAAKQNKAPEKLIQDWIRDKLSTEGLEKMPDDPRKPLFVYGMLKPGELGHEQISDNVIPERTTTANVTGAL
jgi:hypothetical protein